MNELRLKYPVRMMRRIMNVSASGYYAWVDRPLSKRAQEEVRLELEIMAAHQRNRQTYGPERLQRDLAEHGVRVGVCRIKRIRQKLGIRCKQKRRFSRHSPDRTTFPGYSSRRDAANYNLAFQGRQMRPDSLKFLLSWTNHRPAKRKISKPLVYDQVSSLGSPFALYDPVTVINPDAPKVD